MTYLDNPPGDGVALADEAAAVKSKGKHDVLLDASPPTGYRFETWWFPSSSSNRNATSNPLKTGRM